MKKVLKLIALFVLGAVLLFGIFLVYSTVKDYKPEPEELLSEAKGDVVNVYDTINLFSWNIGYCGLSKEMSFFYEGGEKTRTTKEQTEKNLDNITQVLKSIDTIDFYLLQEVDVKSKRSYNINQLDRICSELSTLKKSFAHNYKVKFVPVPVTSPMGNVESGLTTLSRNTPFKVERYSFEGNYTWPKSIMMLDRCYMVSRFYTSNGKELVLINTHNSAYDDGGLRKKQIEQLKTFLIAEYEKGNYIIVGGDWNQNPPIEGKETTEKSEKHITQVRIAYDFMPSGWAWMTDGKTPTNRLVGESYKKGRTLTSIIDFYLISPNLVPVKVHTIDLDFENSDHQPVLMSVGFRH